MSARYFRSWGSVTPPRQPADPVEYAETERAASFYIGRYDGPRLRRFEKVFPVLTPVHTVTLARPREPGAWVYLRPDARGEVAYDEARVVDYAATEGLRRYGRATVGPDGLHADLHRIDRTTPFVDEYTYGPDGALRAATVAWENGTVEHYEFDPDGSARFVG